MRTHFASRVGVAGIALFATLVVVAPASAGPTGACCFIDAKGDQDCDILSAAACAKLVPPGAYQGDDTSCGLCAFVDCAADPGNCQVANIPQFPGGVILTANATRDNFVPTVTQDITSVCFWGAYISGGSNVDCAPGSGDIVIVTYFQNVEGFPPTPGAILASFDVSATTSKVATGLQFGLGGFDDLVAEYEYTATHPPVPVTAGVCYWIEITIDPVFPWDCETVPDGNVGINDFLDLLGQWGGAGACDFDGGGVGINDFLELLAHWGPVCNWFWEVSPEGMDSLSIQADFDENPFDMAWCIDQTLDSTQICPPITAGCEDATNSCLVESGAPGCNNGECCSLVCEQVPFCCAVQWVVQCALAAAEICVTEFPSFELTSPDGSWRATISPTGQILDLFTPDQPDTDNVFETILYEASTVGDNLSRPVDTNFVLVEASILDGGTRSLARLEGVDSTLIIEIENTMIDGPSGGVRVTVRCENTGPDAVDCKIFLYCDMDISGDFGDDEAMLIPDPPVPALIAIEQIDCNSGAPAPCEPEVDGFKPLWFGGCGPYKSWEIDTFAFLRTALNGGIAQLANVDGTTPGSDDHTSALSSETATLLEGETSEISFGLGGVAFSCEP